MSIAFATPVSTSSSLITSTLIPNQHRPQSHRHTPSCSMRPYLELLVAGKSLSRNQARDAIQYSVSGNASDAEIAALLAMMQQKGESSDEVTGVVDALKQSMVPVNADYNVLDIVGTGGDGFSTVNISTAASIVAAAAGCKVAKHGNRSVSSKSGSADVLEAMGVNIQLNSSAVARCIENVGIGFMFAPTHHPAMRFVKGVRSALKIPTVFNVVGPLLNPCSAKFGVIGVYSPHLLDIMADVLIEHHVKKAVVVHTAGMDEFSNTGVSQVIEINDGVKSKAHFDALEELGMARVHVSALRGGDADLNARIIKDVLAGKPTGPVADAIALNAGVGCYVYGLDNSIKDGVKRVQEILREGAAASTLEKWAAESGRS